jgi:hypothetical protein
MENQNSNDLNNLLDDCDLDSCNPQSSQNESDKEEDSQTFVDELQKTLLAPIISGVYITRMDIKTIAKEFGESIAIDERKKMLKQLFKYVDSVESMEKLFNSIKKSIIYKQSIYKELSNEFPATGYKFEELLEKSNIILKRLDQLIIEAKEESLS